MYQVILRLAFIARHTRKATDHCFSFYILVGMYMKFLFHFITFCVLKSYCYFCPKAMYQVILRPRLSRDTRGRRRIIAFLFYILVGKYMKFLFHFITFCVLKSYCSLCRESDADFHMSVFYSSSLASSSSLLPVCCWRMSLHAASYISE